MPALSFRDGNFCTAGATRFAIKTKSVKDYNPITCNWSRHSHYRSFNLASGIGPRKRQSDNKFTTDDERNFCATTCRHKAEFDDLRQNGVALNVSNYRQYENDQTAFYVPFNECLSLYWQAADVYIEKMKTDVQ